MLRVYDERDEKVSLLATARQGVLRTYTEGAASGLAGLRCCLVADLVRRVGERHRLRVTGWYEAGRAAGGTPELAEDWAALNIHPLSPVAGPPEPPDLGIGPRRGSAGARWLAPGPVRIAGQEQTGPVAAAFAARGLDPLSLRLALLQRPYRQPAEPTWDDLAAAGRQLQLWREAVADWANSPSKPMCAQYTGDVKAAFDDDLDSPAALRHLAALAADGEIPPGSRFESFVHLDHLLGLDLARHIGR